MTGLGQLLERAIVSGTLSNRARKDRGIGGNTAHRVLRDSPFELTSIDHFATQLVGPNALTGRCQPM
jgi:hypothetical protein